ncbi:unnamed protein product [Allacma fusca]|uniref:2-hydroxyacyl-CoA lyase 2 n=1 Tax=Allacma fusca TaxID=39272 RepID=A0A8J2NW69_9HEXA|nr:unnamed protein product [Allacma fusca]
MYHAVPKLRLFVNRPRNVVSVLNTYKSNQGTFSSNVQQSRQISYLFKDIDEKSTKNGGELVAEVFKSHGVKFVYTLVGGHVSPILVASEKQGIKVVDTRHEASAVFAADATARLSGKVGVAVVTAGPGVTNTITAVKNAQMAESPVIIIGGAAATLAKGRGALQDIEQIGLFKSCCKKSYSVTAIRQIIPTLKEACQVAMSGTPGPVFVEMPIDVLYPYSTVAQESVLKDPKNILQWITSKYINYHLKYVFGGAFENVPSTDPLPVEYPKATAEQISETAKLVREGKKPVIIVGSQATIQPTPVDDVAAALTEMGIPCFLGGMARGLLGADSSIQMKHKRREALKDADVVILAGAICDFRLGYGRSLPKKGKIVAVNRDKDKMLLNSKQFWHPALAAQSDVGYFLTELAKELKGYKPDPAWVQTLRDREDVREKELDEKASKVTDKHLNPIKVLQAFDKVLPDNAILVADGGDFVGSAAYVLRPRKPLSWLDPGPFGTLGVGGGFALGAKLSRPESQVWVIYGDGSLGYSVMEYDSFVRHKAPVLSIVGNDAGWTQIAREQVPMLGSDVACKLAYSNYQDIVPALGGKGELINRDNEDKMEKILLDAQEANKKGESVLVNVLIGRTDFRDGSISV